MDNNKPVKICPFLQGAAIPQQGRMIEGIGQQISVSVQHSPCIKSHCIFWDCGENEPDPKPRYFYSACLLADAAIALRVLTADEHNRRIPEKKK